VVADTATQQGEWAHIFIAGYVTLAPLKHSHFDSHSRCTVRGICWHCHVYSLSTYVVRFGRQECFARCWCCGCSPHKLLHYGRMIMAEAKHRHTHRAGFLHCHVFSLCTSLHTPLHMQPRTHACMHAHAHTDRQACVTLSSLPVPLSALPCCMRLQWLSMCV
jgi:hypothetical protein